MTIGANTDIWKFMEYAQNVGKRSIARATVTADNIGKRTIRIIPATDDRLYSLFRTRAAKQQNAYVRDLFYNCIAKLFGGSDHIPQSVKAVLTNFGGNNEKPLTARRIRYVIAAIERLPEPEPVSEVGGLLPPEPQEQKADPLSDFITAKQKADQAYADEASGKKSLFSVLSSFSFSSFTGALGKLVSSGISNGNSAGGNAQKTPAAKVFTATYSGITYADLSPDEEKYPKNCEEVRRRFVASVDSKLKENGVPERVRAKYIKDLKDALLSDAVKGRPLEVNDPHVKKALEFATSKDTQYEDTVSTTVANRGTLKVDTAKFLGSLLVQNLLGEKLGSKDAISWSSVSVNKGENGFLNFTVSDLKMKELNSDNDFFKLLKDKVINKRCSQITIPLKPIYDPQSGKLSVTIGKINLGNPVIEATLSLFKGVLLDNITTSELAPVRRAELSDDEEAAECFAKIELNLRRMGAEQLVGLNLNESLGANLKDIKFSENGVVVQFGDNVPPPEGGNIIAPDSHIIPHDRHGADTGNTIADFANDHTSVDCRPIGDSNASMTIAPDAYRRTVENALRGKIAFSSFNMMTVPGTNGAPGRLDISLADADLSRLADNGSWKVKLAHKMGLLNPGNIRLSLRPTVDPISKRVRLDIVSLSYGDGMKNFLANKFLPKILNGILSGKVKGAGVASGPDDCIASVSMDPAQALEKLAIKIPGEMPKIKAISIDDNGLSVGISF